MESFESVLVILPFVCRLVMRTTIWRAPESARCGSFDARSETTRTPVKKVDGPRMYLSRLQVTFSPRRRRLIRPARSFASPGQQILFKDRISPLLLREDGLVNGVKLIQ